MTPKATAPPTPPTLHAIDAMTSAIDEAKARCMVPIKFRPKAGI